MFAYWKKCDFQVHTPRDPNWTGPRPIGQGEEIPGVGAKATARDVDAARAAWAKDFVHQCVTKGLEAVALGRSCYDVPRDHYSGTERLRDLTIDTLVSKGGRVTLMVVQDGATFKIVRSQQGEQAASVPTGSVR
jgi:hypothetical protein